MNHTAYKISTLWVKLRSQMQNKLQTWYWSIMPQAEQSRSAIFESKLIDLKEWETTLAVILLLLICDNTNKMCQLEWAMYCKHPGGEQRPHKKSQEERRGEMAFKRVTVLRRSRWEGWSFQGPSDSPFHRMTKSLQDQNTNLFKASISWCSAQRGNSQIPLPSLAFL